MRSTAFTVEHDSATCAARSISSKSQNVILRSTGKRPCCPNPMELREEDVRDAATLHDPSQAAPFGHEDDAEAYAPAAGTEVMCVSAQLGYRG